MAGAVEYVLADLGSGVYHRGIDNYGDASTPVFGAQIEAFRPWTINRRQAAPTTSTRWLAQWPMLGFVAVCWGCVMFSQQSHSWVHITKSRLPPLMVTLQDLGLLVPWLQHAAHHRAPYDNNYRIVRVFKALEMVLSFKFGLRPWCWSDPNSDWTEDVEEDLFSCLFFGTRTFLYLGHCNR
ncbi:hypothetical protein ACJRO7_022513 [Eucalyptus globulus]|uniref:Lipid desaturase domain-containing protein n=1 Tax=Eucalyptus globulus TaxID=34317 RepID=A0ABD3K3Q9_EUCGL